MSSHLRAIGAPNPDAGPIHILHVADASFFSHFGRMFRQLAFGLLEEGFRVSLLTDFAEIAPQFEASPVECHCVPALSGWRAWRLARELDGEFEPPPQVVHVWGAARFRRVASWAWSRNLPLVVSALSHEDLSSIRRGISPHRAHVAAACEAFATTLRASDHRWMPNVFVLPPALLVSGEEAVDLTGTHACGIVCVARLDRDGGIRALLDAVAALRAEHQDFQVVLLSDGGDAGFAYSRITQLKLHDCVSLIEDPLLWDRAIAGADVMVVPARMDSVTLAPLLAMALGRVVLVARGQPGEWFIDDGTCWEFSGGQARELQSLLARAIARGPDAVSLAVRASEYVARHFSVSRRAVELAGIYHTAMRAGCTQATS